MNDPADLLNGDLLEGDDELSGDEVSGKKRPKSRKLGQTNPVKFAPFTGTATTVPAGGSIVFTIQPTRPMIVQSIVLEGALTGTTAGLQITQIDFGDERQAIAAGNIPGSALSALATGKLRLSVLPAGVVSSITVSNPTAAAVDDVAVCAIGWTTRGN